MNPITWRVLAALYISECWYDRYRRPLLKWMRPNAYRARAVVSFDRVLNEPHEYILA